MFLFYNVVSSHETFFFLLAFLQPCQDSSFLRCRSFLTLSLEQQSPQRGRGQWSLEAEHQAAADQSKTWSCSDWTKTIKKTFVPHFSAGASTFCSALMSSLLKYTCDVTPGMWHHFLYLGGLGHFFFKWQIKGNICCFLSDISRC